MTSPIPLDQIGQGAIGLGILVAGAFTGWQSLQAKRQAKKAAEHSYPISNGWGTALRDDMAKLAASMQQLERRQTAADERDATLLGLATAAASHARTAAEQSAAVSTGLAAHLADHASTDAIQGAPL